MHIFNKNIQIVFLSKCTTKTDIILSDKESIDLILLPSLYWFKKERLPVKTLYQAKKLAESIFAEFIPAGDYSYAVFKDQDGCFAFFAYQDEMILKKLEELGIRSTQIRKVYFAQLELRNLKQPIKICDDRVVMEESDTLIEVPLDLVPQFQSSKHLFDSIQLSSHAVYLKNYSTTIISEQKIYIISLLFFLFIVIYFVEYLLLKKDYNATMVQKERVIQQYRLPQTSIQLRSIMHELQSIEKVQMALREKLAYLFMVPLQNGEKFKSVEYRNSVMHIRILLSHPNRAQELQHYFAKKFHILKMQVYDKELIASMKI